MESSPSVAKSAGMGAGQNHILSNTTDLIQLKASDQDDIDKSNNPFQAMVHKDLLCFFSKYYRAALQGGFLEAGNKSVVLDLKTADCHNLVGWLYTGRLSSNIRMTQLLDLFIFADKTDMLALRRTTITRIVEDFKMPKIQRAAILLGSLPFTSPLSRMVLDRYIHHWLFEYHIDEDVLPNAFLIDWVKGAAARTTAATSECDDDCPCGRNCPCNYHEHESIEEWTSTCGATHDPKIKQPGADYLRNSTSLEASPKTDGDN